MLSDIINLRETGKSARKMEANRGTQCRFSLVFALDETKKRTERRGNSLSFFFLALLCHHRQIKGINDDCNPTSVRDLVMIAAVQMTGPQCAVTTVLLSYHWRFYQEGESVPCVERYHYDNSVLRAEARGMSRRLSTPAKERLVLIKRQEL